MRRLGEGRRSAGARSNTAPTRRRPRPGRGAVAFCALLACACDGEAPIDAGPPDTGPRVEPDAGPPPEYVADDRWHRQVVFYELWVRSFQDSDGDGIGDLPGLTSRLDYLEELGVGAVWLMPFFPSPLADSGYDVADYVGVHPDYGTLDDFDAMIAEAHARGLRVYVDLVFNHTSTEHPWFLESRADASSERGDWFVWADEAGLGCDGAAGPFGDVRWTRDDVRGQFYFHQFYAAQPDLNFDRADMREALLDVARFWLDRGADGFRLDVPYRYDEDLPSCVHRPGTFEFLRSLRAVTESYDERSMVGEILAGPEQTAAYLEDDVLEMAFILAESALFWVAANGGNVTALRDTFDELARVTPPGGAFAPTLGNHDLPRTTESVMDDDGALRAMAGAQLTLPGVPFVYYGEELAMLPGTDEIVDGRDSARTPMQWDASANAGFTSGTPFLAMAPEATARTVEAAQADAGSLYHFYRRLIALRNDTPALRTGTYQSMGGGRRTLAFWRRHPEGDRFCATDFGSDGEGAVRFTLPEAWSSATAIVDDVSGEEVGVIVDGRFEGAIPARATWVLRPAE